MSAKFLPCPFCGGPAGEVAFEFITCLSAEIGAEQTCPGKLIHLDVEEAERWNTRAAMPQGEPVALATTLEHWAEALRTPTIAEHTVSDLAMFNGRCITEDLEDAAKALRASPSLPVSEAGVRETLDAMSLAVELLPRRKERIGGQTHSYVSLENVLAILEAQP